ncbi:carotenoid biosynthesis protein [Skermania sp. ID1734]|nr:carotenoid biosynthesis protein [Skermania sp. ID1734]
MATQIVYPLVSGGARDAITVAVVVLLAGACLTHALVVRGFGWAAGFALVTVGLGLVVEIIGSTTGFPFGCYDYAVGRLGPAVAGVPLVVPLAWAAGVYPIWTVAALLCRRALRISLAALTIVGWDLYLDPQMVTDGQWSWCSPHPNLPGLAAIPVTNYLGWFAVALVMTALIEALPARELSPGVSTVVPVALFVWTWLGSCLAHAVFLSGAMLRFSALYGLVGMGILGVPLLVRIVTVMRERPPIDATRAPSP